MDFQYKITVIVPIYNAELYISKCIDSILKQTYSHLQIILIDDGSTDSSGKICDRYANLDKRVEVYHTTNNGLVAARKLGLQLSNGKYIGFVDADDYIEPNMFLELYNLMQIYDVDFIHSGYIEKSFNEEKLICNFEEQIVKFNSFKDRLDFIYKYILKCPEGVYITSSLWSKLFKIEFIKKCYETLSDTQQYGEDFLCLLKCIMEAQELFLSKKTMYHYNVRANTLSHIKYVDFMLKEIKLWNCAINFFEKYNCIELLKEDLYYFLKKRMTNVIMSDEQKRIRIPCYFFENIKEILGKKIIIVGAGQVGQDYYNQICHYQNCEIVAWIDSKWKEYNFDYAEVREIEDIINIEYDKIIIAVKEEVVSEEIKDILINLGVLKKNIIWKKPEEYY